jgi:hypothetical protein
MSEMTAPRITARGEIAFEFAGAEYLFKPTLANIAALEEKHGSLWLLVEKIEKNALPLSGLAASFAVMLPQMTEEEIGTEILQKGAAHYLLLLLQICAPLLTGLSAIGAAREENVPAGEDSPRCAGL